MELIEKILFLFLVCVFLVALVLRHKEKREAIRQRQLSDSFNNNK